MTDEERRKERRGSGAGDICMERRRGRRDHCNHAWLLDQPIRAQDPAGDMICQRAVIGQPEYHQKAANKRDQKQKSDQRQSGTLILAFRLVAAA